MKKILLFIVTVNLSYAQTHKNVYECFPQTKTNFKKNQIFNDLKLDDAKTIVEKFQSSWNEYLLKNFNKSLTVNLEWGNEDVNAVATRDMLDNFIINLYGGMVRHKEQTVEGIYLVLCHELGHFIGGAPKAFRGRSNLRSWSSAEGQADYFASNKCMIRLYDLGIFKNKYISENQKCPNSYCHLISKSAQDLGSVFATMKRDWKKPVFGSNNLSSVKRTNYGHPEPQCRLNTFLAGQACSEKYYMNSSDTDARIGACMLSTNPNGGRPSCWFSEEAE